MTRRGLRRSTLQGVGHRPGEAGQRRAGAGRADRTRDENRGRLRPRRHPARRPRGRDHPRAVHSAIPRERLQRRHPRRRALASPTSSKRSRCSRAEELREVQRRSGADDAPVWIIIPFMGLFVTIGFTMVGVGLRTKTGFPLLFGGFFGGMPLLMAMAVAARSWPRSRCCRSRSAWPSLAIRLGEPRRRGATRFATPAAKAAVAPRAAGRWAGDRVRDRHLHRLPPVDLQAVSGVDLQGAAERSGRW